VNKLDYIIVGAGLSGATFARYATDRGKKCLVLDKRKHIAGNIFSQNVDGIEVHKYGPHIFHTNSEKIWNYVNQFAAFNDYRHKVLVNCGDEFFSFPINLKTLESLWGIKDDAELIKKFENGKSKHKPKENLEDWAIAEVGEEIYRKLIYGYTKKQWGVSPAKLPPSIISRIPVRQNRNDDYHNCKFSGIPLCGYTDMVANMLFGIEVQLETDYFQKRYYWDSIAKNIIYTGPIDEFFGYKYGEMEWRSLRFQEQRINQTLVQQVAQINFVQENVPFTRSVEHKHFIPSTLLDKKYTIITKEYPEKYVPGLEKYYPVCSCSQENLLAKYKKLIPSKFIFIGRLAKFKYYNMDQAIALSLSKARLVVGN
jgi:UDP-galactopyranose mutase